MPPITPPPPPPFIIPPPLVFPPPLVLPPPFDVLVVGLIVTDALALVPAPPLELVEDVGVDIGCPGVAVTVAVLAFEVSVGVVD
jgi:hypothetical protein